MRWFWVDQFTKFVSGESAESIKCVSLSEEVVDEYAPGRTYLPASLIIEGLAQTGGLLIGQMTDFTARVVLAKLNSSKFHFEAYPGDTLKYSVKIINQDGIGTLVSATAHIDGKLQTELEMMFATLDDERFLNVELFEPAEFCRMIRLMRLFEVGVNPDGSPVSVPTHMVDAEKAYLMMG